MSVISIATPFNIDLEFTIASFGKRFLAWLIDTAIQVGWYLAYVFLLHDRLAGNERLRWVIIIVVVGLPLTLYHFLMEVFFSGQSIGKKIVGIRVVNFTGNEASVSQYLIRLLFRAVGFMWIMFILFIDIIRETGAGVGAVAAIFTLTGMAMVALFLFYILSKYGQRLGDRLANTLVIENRVKADIHKTIYLEISDEAYQVRYPEVMRLTDRDINGIRNLLDVKRMNKDHEAYMSRIASRIIEVLGITTSQEPHEFLSQLLRDYNFLTSK